MYIGCTFTDLWWSPILCAVKSGLVCAGVVLAVSTCHVLAMLAGGKGWKAVRPCVYVCARLCVGHVRFSSSVNVEDYFLRDQNWLPRIRPPSIFSHTSRTQGRLCGAEAHGKKSCDASWAGDEAVRQRVAQSPPQQFVTETFVCVRAGGGVIM